MRATLVLALALAGCGRSQLGIDAGEQPPPELPTVRPEPLVGALRWDAWMEGNDKRNWVAPSLYSRYSHRQPFYGWFSSNLDEAVERDIVEREIAFAAAGGLDYWSFVWYPEQAKSQGEIQQPFNHYLASPNREQVRFTLVLTAGWLAYPNDSWSLYESDFLPAFARLFNDPAYLKVDGNKPVVMLFHSAKLPEERLEQLRQTSEDAGLDSPYFVDVNMNWPRAQELGLNAVTSYGPSGARPRPDENCFPELAARDVKNWGPRKGLQTVVSLTPMADPRPREYGYRVDQPTRRAWRQHLGRAFDWVRAHPDAVSNPALMLIYNWNELDEGGPGIVPTLQEGTRYLDDLWAVRSGDTSSYVDVMNGNHCDIVRDDAWIEDFPEQGIASNRDNDEQISATPGSVLTLTTEGVGFEWLGTRGPDRGQAEVFLDGQLLTTVDLYQEQVERHAPIHTLTGLPPGKHAYRIRALGSKVDAASAAWVGVDELRVTR